jgi:hypothetical protein
MRKFIAFFLPVFVFCIGLFGVSSCSKSDRSKDTDLQAGRDMSLAVSCWNDLFRQMNMFAGSQADLNTIPGPAVLNACGTVTVVPALPDTTFPKTFTIDFGASNCAGPDGAQRKGKIIATFSGKYRDSLTTISITTSNYYFNNFKIDGTFSIHNNGRNSSGNQWFTETASNAVFTYPTGVIVKWSSVQKREMIQGASTPVIFDDVYQITGNAIGNGSDGSLINTYIDKPLVFSMDCPWIESGTLYLDPANLANRFVDFGTGACDNKADVWIFADKYTLYLY